mmetsp:Transcript_13401/g.36027  ORF Transcript_13401/g.36027 Transcript_13401/m.36027 type:complete len:208 (-) Transcript_13401:175-798(-)
MSRRVRAMRWHLAHFSAAAHVNRKDWKGCSFATKVISQIRLAVHQLAARLCSESLESRLAEAVGMAHGFVQLFVLGYDAGAGAWMLGIAGLHFVKVHHDAAGRNRTDDQTVQRCNVANVMCSQGADCDLTLALRHDVSQRSFVAFFEIKLRAFELQSFNICCLDVCSGASEHMLRAVDGVHCLALWREQREHVRRPASKVGNDCSAR